MFIVRLLVFKYGSAWLFIRRRFALFVRSFPFSDAVTAHDGARETAQQNHQPLPRGACENDTYSITGIYVLRSHMVTAAT